MKTNDPVLQRFRAALDEAYGRRLERVVLYGAREARPDSDYDIAVFLKDFTSLEGAFDLTTGFMQEVRRDGRL